MNFKGVLGKLLPTIGAALPLPPPLGNMAAKYIGKAIGVPDLKPEDAEKAIVDAQVNDPEILLKLKQADAEFAQQMKAMDVNLEQIYAEDRASARTREIEIKDNTPKILAFAVVSLTFAAESFLLIHGQPANLDGVVLGRVMGTLDAALVMVLAYYFGSSSGSAQKSKALEVIAKDKV
jgi:hypothetical protein